VTVLIEPFRSSQHSGTDANITIAQPISRRFMNPEGKVHVRIDVSAIDTVNESYGKILYFSLRHEETGCEIHLHPPSNITSTGNATMQQLYHSAASSSSSARDIDLITNSTHFVEEQYDEEEDENSDFAQSEDDNFIAASSDDEFENDDEVCRICRDGGNMIVCDGGVQFTNGCGNSFHIACIQRNEIPPGDWICQQCASDNGTTFGLCVEVGIQGYEFPMEPTTTQIDADRNDYPVNVSKPHRKRLQSIKNEDPDNEYSNLDCSSPTLNNMVHSKSDGDDDDSESRWERNRVAKRQRIIDSDDEQDM
jgi:PHD-finger